MVEIIEVPLNNKKLVKSFIDFPHELFKGDPNYVPEIFIGQKELMSPKKNPFFKHSKVQLFLAYKDENIVGRIAAIRNNNYNNFSGEQAGFFGFFDVIEDYEVARMLLDKAIFWIKQEGLKKALGPTNFSSNDTMGILVEGFDRPPTIMMTYNKPYYPEFLDRYGFEKDMDLLAYWLPTSTASQRSILLAERLEERLNKRGITIRKVRLKDFKQEAALIKEVYNAAWEKNWGFVPATDEEFQHLAEGLKLIINPDFTYIAEHEGKPIGFSLSVPDINEILRGVKRGRLLPFGIFKLLYGKNRVKKVRIITLGVIPGYRKMGIEAIFYAWNIRSAQKYNLDGGEASWILENNALMNKGMEDLNAKVYKKYRMYKLPLA